MSSSKSSFELKPGQSKFWACQPADTPKYIVLQKHNSVQHNSVNLLANARHSESPSYGVIWAVSKVTANLFSDMPRQILYAEAIPAEPGLGLGFFFEDFFFK